METIFIFAIFLGMFSMANENERAAILLLKRGLATQSEVAALAGTSRQLVAHWALRARIDARGARQAKLRELWRKALDYAK